MPFDQVHERVEAVGQVGLQRDAGVEGRELGLLQQAAEGSHGQLEVVVLLHVEVDERRRRRGRGGSKQGAQSLADPVQRPVEVPRIELGHHRRHFHRHVVDVGHSKGVEHLGVAAPGLGLAQDGLAQHAHVQRVALRGPGPQVGRQPLGLGVHDQVADEGPHAALGDRHDQPRQPGAEPRPEPQQQPVQRRQERGQPRLGHQRGQLARGDGGILGPDHPVDEPHGEGGGRRVRHHTRQAPGRGAVPPGRQRPGRLQPSRDTGHSLLGQQIGAAGVAVHALLAPSCREALATACRTMIARIGRRRCSIRVNGAAAIVHPGVSTRGPPAARTHNTVR